jgi:hypothetical protein
MADLPYTFATLPACRQCGCLSFNIDGTVKQDDGSKVNYANCAYCGLRQKILWDVPPGGIRLSDLRKIQA